MSDPTTNPITPLEMLVRAAAAPTTLEKCLEELAQCNTTATAQALRGTALAGDLLPLLAQQARHLAAAQAHLQAALREARPPPPPPSPPPPQPQPSAAHSMRTRGLDTKKMFYQDSKIIFAVIVEGPISGLLTVQLRLRSGEGFLVDELLRGSTAYAVPPNGECFVGDTAIAGLSSKNGGSFRFQIEVRASNGTVVLAGLTPPFQVWTKRLKFKPSLDSLRAGDPITQLPAIGPTYAQKMREEFNIVTIGDLAAVDPAMAQVICNRVRRERGVLRPPAVVRAIELAREIARR